MDGYGVIIWSDGEKYQGDWKNNQMHGQGILTHPHGEIYEGEWKNN